MHIIHVHLLHSLITLVIVKWRHYHPTLKVHPLLRRPLHICLAHPGYFLKAKVSPHKLKIQSLFGLMGYFGILIAVNICGLLSNLWQTCQVIHSLENFWICKNCSLPLVASASVLSCATPYPTLIVMIIHLSSYNSCKKCGLNYRMAKALIFHWITLSCNIPLSQLLSILVLLLN